MVHGQCTDVGVGGYLLGGGVNVAGSTTRYGLGSENVVEYEMVTADGEIVVVNKDRVTKKTYDGYEASKTQLVFLTFSISVQRLLIYVDHLSAQQR